MFTIPKSATPQELAEALAAHFERQGKQQLAGFYSSVKQRTKDEARADAFAQAAQFIRSVNFE